MQRSASRPRSAASGARSNTATATTATASAPAGYVGRFAPSPTGPLHLGSLTTAVASYLEARARAGRWLVRIDDLDQARGLAGMADEHLRTLEALGFQWDGPIRIQSRATGEYGEALERLRMLGRVYPCTCSRAEIAALRPRDPDTDEEELHYPGLCRTGVLAPGRTAAQRFVAPDAPVSFVDRWQGTITERVGSTCGDFIVRRRDSIIAYQLAVVVDDAAQGVTDVVRGSDLLMSTPRQLLLQEALGLPSPSYAHAPLVVAADGQKLAKSRHAVGVDEGAAARALVGALRLLGQPVARELARAGVTEVWARAEAGWNPGSLQNMRSTRVPD